MKTYNVQVPDYDYWRTQIKCQTGCPVDTDSRGYVRAIARGDYEEAYMIARAPNPLASMCGRICAAPCEANCRRGSIDGAVSIRALKRFVTERYGAERDTAHGHGGAGPKGLAVHGDRGGEHECHSNTEYAALKDFGPGKAGASGKTIGIIGAGPAGLSAAHDLSLLGHEAVIYEMASVAGGMLAMGVPAYRLPRDLIRAEVEAIVALGVKIEYGVQVGRHISMDELRQRHDAVLVSVGMRLSRSIPLDGTELDGVLGGVDFLADVALKGAVPLKPRVVVIGGGNVAYDVARTAVRQKGVTEVHLFCLESLEEMPADEVEIREGEEEGIRRYNRWGPKAIVGGANGVAAFDAKRCISVFDHEGRFSPTFDEFETMRVEADQVILAVGQASDTSFAEGLDQDRGRILHDAGTLTTSQKDVFIAGDIAYGPRIAIDAVASGKKAARSIHRFLTGESVEAKKKWRFLQFDNYGREARYEKLPRQPVPTVGPAERGSMTGQVEIGFEPDAAQEQGSRCLICNVNTIFHGEKCILCGGCADVCPERCLKLVSLARIWQDKEFKQLADTRYGGADWTEQHSAIIKDEEPCIRCALCANRCPTGAITMEKFVFSETFK